MKVWSYGIDGFRDCTSCPVLKESACPPGPEGAKVDEGGFFEKILRPPVMVVAENAEKVGLRACSSAG